MDFIPKEPTTALHRFPVLPQGGISTLLSPAISRRRKTQFCPLNGAIRGDPLNSPQTCRYNIIIIISKEQVLFGK
jgi:hypothetical protein